VGPESLEFAAALVSACQQTATIPATMQAAKLNFRCVTVFIGIFAFDAQFQNSFRRPRRGREKNASNMKRLSRTQRAARQLLHPPTLSPKVHSCEKSKTAILLSLVS
jgi:hypothetical protein